MRHLAVFVALAAPCAGTSEACCSNRLVNVGIVNATREPWWKFHADSTHLCGAGLPCRVESARCNLCWSGLVPDLHRELAGHMKYRHQFVAAAPGTSQSQFADLVRGGAVHMLPHELTEQTFTPTWRGTVRTMPFVTYTYSAMVRSDSKETGSWRMFAPFAGELWVVITGFLVVFMLVFWALECKLSDTGSAQGLIRSGDFVISSVLGGMEYDGVREDGWAGRFLRLYVLFFTMIVTATYTANLASILTAKRLVLSGPRTMDQLRTSTVCSFDVPPVRASFLPYVGGIVTPEVALGAGRASEWEATPLGRRTCIEMVVDGRAEAVVANQLELEQMKADFGYCRSLLRIDEISFLPRYVSLVLSEADADLAGNVTETLVHLQQTGTMLRMMDANYVSECTQAAADDGDEQMKPKHLAGLFIIGAAFVLATGPLAVAIHWVRKRTSSLSPSPYEVKAAPESA